MIKFREIPVDTIEFDENKTKKIKIPRVNAIRWIQMRFFVKTVENNTADPTEIQDTILNIIKKIRLVIDGDDNRFNVDGRKWFFMEKFEKGTEPYTNKDDDQAINTTKTWEVQLRADFATNRLDETDISALLPAKKYSKLDLEIDWGSLSDMFSANTSGLSITDADSGCEVEIREAFDPEDKINFPKGLAGEGFLEYREAIQEIDIDKQYANVSEGALNLDVKPAPVKILKELLLVEDKDGVRSNTDVEKVRVVDTRGSGETKIKRDWDVFWREMKAEYGIESLDDGVIHIDWIDKLGSGLDNFDTEGALKYKFQTASPTGTPKIKVLTRYLNGKA